ncbi:MAG: hypothetical protein HDR19_02590 [Lachnospiraceae bacterium]|nr:hypothetical protein [Lachnospiraceae bacterium]
MWKHNGINKYPEIILHDCSIANIEKEGDDIVVDFDKRGFWVKDFEKDMYYRTHSARIVIKDYDADYLTITEIRTQQLSEKKFFETVHEVKPKCFIKNINKGKWIFEVVEEFYSEGRALYIGQVQNKKKYQKSFWCCVKLEFKELLYLWNEIRYDCPW